MSMMLQKENKISIIVPCYNVEKYIEECLESILGQHAFEGLMEIIVIDDFSTDNTIEILNNYENKYPNKIMLIPLAEHIGLAGRVRNIALEYASGDYIVFVDADDLLERDFLKTMCEHITKTKSDVVSCGYAMFDDDGLYMEDVLDDIEYNLFDMQCRKKILLNEGTRTSVWARIYSRKFVNENKIKFSDTYRLAEDMYFWHYCMLKATKVSSISNVLYKYRVKRDSLFHSKKNNYSEDIIECCSKISKLIMNNDRWICQKEEYAAVLYNKCVNELMGYLEEREVSDTQFATIVKKLIVVLKPFKEELIYNKYLQNDEHELTRTLLGD